MAQETSGRNSGQTTAMMEAVDKGVHLHGRKKRKRRRMRKRVSESQAGQVRRKINQ